MTKLNTPSGRSFGPVSAFMGQSYLLLVLAQVFWGGNIASGKLAVGEIDPILLSVVRWGAALLVVLPFAIGPLRRDWPALKAHWPWLALYGALGFATFNILMYGATHFTSAVNASMEQAAIPVFVMLLNFAIFRVRVTWLQMLGVALTILGVFYTATHGDLGRILGLDVNLGDGMVLLACLCYAIYSLTLRYRPKLEWISFLAATIGAAFATSLIFQFAFGGGVPNMVSGIAATTPRGWLIVLYVALFPSILAQVFYARGVELIGPNRASLFINLLPVCGAATSVLLVGERLEPFHLIAALLIVAGIVLAEWAARRRLHRVSDSTKS